MKIVVPFAVMVVLAVALQAGCNRIAPDRADTSQPSAQVSAAESVDFSIARAAFLLPSGCVATCERGCDSWDGQIRCPQLAEPISVHVSLPVTVMPPFDRRGSHVEGDTLLGDHTRLRWGQTTDGEFCAEIHDDPLYWHIIAPTASAEGQHFILDIAKSYRRTQELAVSCKSAC